jgi:RimJ/RimL family protein N-acetyltransferase
MTSFELQPHLSGEKLLLRPLRADDFENLYAAASDPLIWEIHPQPTRYQRPVFEGFFKLAMESGGAFAAVDKSTQKIVGSSRFYGYNPEKSEIVIGYTFLARSHWGGIFNREMKNLMLTHAFQYVHRVIFEIGENNWRSRKAIEKIGAHLTGSENLDGNPHVTYSLDPAAFRAHL